MKKIAMAAALAGVLVFGTAASCNEGPEPAPEGPTVFEVEDCDAEDWKNYDPECGRPSPRPSARPSKSRTPGRRA